jgi:hypothetical protein
MQYSAPLGSLNDTNEWMTNPDMPLGGQDAPLSGIGWRRRLLSQPMTSDYDLLNSQSDLYNLSRETNARAQADQNKRKIALLQRYANQPLPNIYKPAGSPDEQDLQNILQDTLDAESRGWKYQVADYYDRPRREAQYLSNLQKLQAIRNTDLDNQLAIERANNDQDYREQSLKQNAANQAATRQASAATAFNKSLENDYNDALDFVDSGMDPNQVFRYFPRLTPQQRQRIVGLSQTTNETGAGASARELADEYNQEESRGRELQAHRSANIGGMKSQAEDQQSLRMFGIPIPNLPTWMMGSGSDSQIRAGEAQAEADYPGRSFDLDTYMANKFKTDKYAQKLIRRGPNGWEPLNPYRQAPSMSVAPRGGGMPRYGTGGGGQMSDQELVGYLDQLDIPTDDPYRTVTNNLRAGGYTGAMSGGVVNVTTPQQAYGLPPGTLFRTPDGRVKRRP